MLRHIFKNSRKTSGRKSINWRKFIIARITLVAAFAFLIFYFSYLQNVIVNYIVPADIPPLKIKMVVSAYYQPVPKQKSYYTGSYWQDLALNGYGITFSGKKIQIGYAAADLDYYPIGTKLLVPDLGEVIVEDKGSSIQGPHRLDVFVGAGEDGLRQSIEWGRRELEVEFLTQN